MTAKTTKGRRKTTTQRGLGWQHQQQRDALLANHKDGTPCWWCGTPMHRNPNKNWDHETLAADHTRSRANGGTKADRLLHSRCNKQRGTGDWDTHRPATTNTPPGEWTRATAESEHSHYQQLNADYT